MSFKNKTGFSLINVALVTAIGFGSVTAGAANNEFQYLTGQSVSNSHNAFESQGYKKLHNEIINKQNQVVWWNADQKDCVVSNENYGKVSSIYDVSKSDCDPYISSSDSKTVVGLVAGVAAIAGIAALINHNKHKQQDRNNEARNTEEYDQGYNDGRNNYRSYGSHSESYNNGFAAGKEDRNNNDQSSNRFGSNHHNYNHDSNRNAQSRYVKVSDLYNIRASSGEQELMDRGFRMVDGSKGRNNSYVTWVNYDAKECVNVITQDGRFKMPQIVSMNECI